MEQSNIDLKGIYLTYYECVLNLRTADHDINLVPQEISFEGTLIKVSADNTIYDVPFEQIKTALSFADFKTWILAKFNLCNNQGV